MAETDQPTIQHFGALYDPTLSLTADLVAAYVSNNPLPAADLPDLIRSVRAALAEDVAAPAVDGAPTQATVEIEKPTPAQIKKSITPDALISFLDGRPYKTLRRHLTTHGLTPEGYRARFGLPVDYPMTAPSYSAARSELAKLAGLGRGGVAATSETGPSTGTAPAADTSLAA